MKTDTAAIIILIAFVIVSLGSFFLGKSVGIAVALFHFKEGYGESESTHALVGAQLPPRCPKCAMR